MKTNAESIVEFHLETYRWLGRNVDMEFLLDNVLLVLPAEEYIPWADKYDEEQAEEAFQHVKRYVGIENWASSLEQLDESSYVWDDNIQLVSNHRRSVGACIGMKGSQR